MATLSGTGRPLRHLIGQNCPCRRRPLAAVGARGRSGFPRSIHRARTAAEPGARRRIGARRVAGERAREGTGAQGVAKGQYGAEAGAWPCLPRAVPVFLRRWLLGDSICQRSLFLSPPPSARPRSAAGGRGERGTRRGEPISCQASDEAARRRRETHKERALESCCRRGTREEDNLRGDK